MVRLALIGGDDNLRAAFAHAADRLSGVECVEYDAASIAGTADAVAVLDDQLDGIRQGCDAAKQGKHVFVRLACLAEAERTEQLILACREHGVHLMLGQTFRFLPSVRVLRQALLDKKLGAPGLLRIHHWLPARRDSDKVGLTAQALDVANWLFGEAPSEIYARAGDGPRSDYLQIHLGFRNGGMALIDCSVLDGPADYLSISMIGATGAAYADDHHNMQLLYGDGHPVALRTDQGLGQIAGELREFASSIDEDHAPSVTGVEADAAIQVSRAVQASVTSGRVARLIEESYELD